MFLTSEWYAIWRNQMLGKWGYFIKIPIQIHLLQFYKNWPDFASPTCLTTHTLTFRSASNAHAPKVLSSSSNIVSHSCSCGYNCLGMALQYWILGLTIQSKTWDMLQIYQFSWQSVILQWWTVRLLLIHLRSVLLVKPYNRKLNMQQC